jgi:hypothetical protein
MDRYERGKIYKIICNETGKCYVGSTCEPTLARRLAKHVAHYKYWINNNMNYITSFEIIKNNNYAIVLIENYPFKRKDELHARERYWIENNECVNKYIPTRTIKEYYKDNAEKLKEYNKEYQIENADKIKEYRKEYRNDNADKIKSRNNKYYNENVDKIKEYQKEYKIENAENIKEIKKKYYILNKDKIKERQKEYRVKRKYNNSIIDN